MPLADRQPRARGELRGHAATRPDASVVHGHSAALVNGDKARELVETAGIVLAASWIDYEVPLADVPRPALWLTLVTGDWLNTST